MNRTEAYRKVAKIIADFNDLHDVETSIEMDHELATEIYDSIVPVPYFNDGPLATRIQRPWR
jgi:hypothetical protein